MIPRVRGYLQHHRADAAMIFIVIVWGFHYIVMKKGMADLPPVTYNALRFAVGGPFLTLIALRSHALRRVSRRDMWWMIGVTIIGPLGYQLLYAEALTLTTSTNTALLIATMPLWTALISIALGIIVIRRGLLIAITITFAGVVLVILGQSSGGLSFSQDDLAGSGLAMSAALVASVGNILTKPIVDRLGGMVLAIWTYWLTTIGMLILALPDLIHFQHKEALMNAWPNVIYSGVIAGSLGFLIWNYALRELGPTRAASYQNFPPIIAVLAGIIVLGEPLTWALVIGGPLALIGVIKVGNNTFLRPPGEAGLRWFRRPASAPTARAYNTDIADPDP